MSDSKNPIKLEPRERKRIYTGLHNLSMGEGDPTIPQRVPDIHLRAKSLADELWSPPNEWEQIEIECENLDLWVIFNACFECDRPVNNLAEKVSELYEEPEGPVFIQEPPEHGEDSTEDSSENKAADNVTNPKYGVKFQEIREKALKESNHRCDSCGMSREEHQERFGTDLNAHHIKPVSEFEDYDNAHELSNLRILCLPCHENEHPWMEGLK